MHTIALFPHTQAFTHPCYIAQGCEKKLTQANPDSVQQVGICVVIVWKIYFAHSEQPEGDN